jgi:hypothetical protein
LHLVQDAGYAPEAFLDEGATDMNFGLLDFVARCFCRTRRPTLQFTIVVSSSFN